MFAELTINRASLPLSERDRAWLILCLDVLACEYGKREHGTTPHFILDPPDPEWVPTEERACNSSDTSSDSSASSP
jgi:hypothetical protein